MVPLWLLAALASVTVALDPVCKNVKTFSGDRSNNKVTDSSVPEASMLCDNGLTGWFRFPTASVATTCVPWYHCGSKATLWLMGTLPTSNDGVVSRELCMSMADTVSNTSDCCVRKFAVQVVDCGSFHAFQLPIAKLLCPAAICSKNPMPPITTPPSVSPPIVADDKRTYHHTCSLQKGVCTSAFPCTVLWYMNNVLVSNHSHVMKDSDDIDGATVWAHNMGKNLSCAVRHEDPSSPQTLVTSNNSYFGYIKLYPDKMTLVEGNSDTLTATSSLPVTCLYADAADCRLRLELDTGDGYDDDLFAVENCTMFLTPADWNPVNHTASVHMALTTSVDPAHKGNRTHNATYILDYHTIHNSAGLNTFEGYRIDPSKITVTDQPYSTCSQTTDPHCRSFNSQGSFHHPFCGTYVMSSCHHSYIHTPPIRPALHSVPPVQVTHDFHVLSHHWQPPVPPKMQPIPSHHSGPSPHHQSNHPTSNGQPATLCGVTVGSGCHAIRISMCHGQPGFTAPHITAPRAPSPHLAVFLVKPNVYQIVSSLGHIVLVALQQFMLSVTIHQSPGSTPSTNKTTCTSSVPKGSSVSLSQAQQLMVPPKADLFPANASTPPVYCRCGGPNKIQCGAFTRLQNNPMFQSGGQPVAPTIVRSDEFYNDPVFSFTAHVESKTRNARSESGLKSLEIAGIEVQCEKHLKKYIADHCLVFNSAYRDTVMDICVQGIQAGHSWTEAENFLADKKNVCLQRSLRVSRGLQFDSNSGSEDSFAMDPTALYTVRPEDQIIVPKKWPTSENITEEQAKQYCHDAFTKNTHSSCHQNIAADMDDFIDMCIMDVLNFDGFDHVEATVHSFAVNCESQLMTDKKNYIQQNGKLMFPSTLSSKAICENLCSSHGTCQNGRCVCNNGYGGQDCSVTRGQFLTIRAIERPLCDIGKLSHSCLQPVLLVDNAYTIPMMVQMDDSLVVRTSINAFDNGKPLETDIVVYLDVFSTSILTKYAISIDLNKGMDLQIIDSLLQNKSANSDIASFEVVIQLRVLNSDNQLKVQSNEITYHLYNSLCHQCELDDDTMKCSPKADHCWIDHKCYKSGDRYTTGTSVVNECNPTISQVKWTKIAS